MTKEIAPSSAIIYPYLILAGQDKRSSFGIVLLNYDLLSLASIANAMAIRWTGSVYPGIELKTTLALLHVSNVDLKDDSIRFLSRILSGVQTLPCLGCFDRPPRSSLSARFRLCWAGAVSWLGGNIEVSGDADEVSLAEGDESSEVSWSPLSCR